MSRLKHFLQICKSLDAKLSVALNPNSYWCSGRLSFVFAVKMYLTLFNMTSRLECILLMLLSQFCIFSTGRYR